MTSSTPPSRLVARCPATRALHAEIKSDNPRWRFCPDCDLPLPDVIDLITPPRPSQAAAQPIQSSTILTNDAHHRSAPALTIPGPNPIGSLISSTETAIRDRHRSEKETRKPKNTLSAQIGVTLYSGEYTIRSVGGLNIRDYVQIIKHSKYQTQPLELTQQYPSHRDLIYGILQRLHIKSDLLSKEWRIIQSVTLGNGSGVTELAADVESLTSIRAIVIALRAKKIRDDNEDKYNLMLLQDQQVEFEDGSTLNKKGKRVIAKTRPVQLQKDKKLEEHGSPTPIKQEDHDNIPIKQENQGDQGFNTLITTKEEEDQDRSALIKAEIISNSNDDEQSAVQKDTIVS